MSDDRWKRYLVTDDPQLEAKLWARFRARSDAAGLDSFELAEYAHTLGLYPPGYEEGQKDAIYSHISGPGEPPVLMWDTDYDRPPSDYLDPVDDEDDDESSEPDWGDVVSIVLPDDESKKS